MGRSIPICIVGATLKLSFDGHRKEGQEEFSVQKSSEHSMKWSLRWIHCIEKLCLLILEFISFANLQSARKQSLVLIQWRCRSRMQTLMRCSRLKWWNWPRQPWTDSTLRRTWPTGSRKSWTDNTRHFGTSLSAATLAPTSLMRPSTLCTSTLMSLQCFVIRRGEDYLMGCWDGFHLLSWAVSLVGYSHVAEKGAKEGIQRVWKRIPVISTVVTLFELEQSLKHLWELAAPIVAAMQIECAVKYLMRWKSG